MRATVLVLVGFGLFLILLRVANIIHAAGNRISGHD